jgi:hypothetical protein
MPRCAAAAGALSYDRLAFVRAYFDDRVLVILNRSKSARDVVSIDPCPEITVEKLKNLLTGEEIVQRRETLC